MLARGCVVHIALFSKGPEVCFYPNDPAGSDFRRSALDTVFYNTLIQLAQPFTGLEPTTLSTVLSSCTTLARKQKRTCVDTRTLGRKKISFLPESGAVWLYG